MKPIDKQSIRIYRGYIKTYLRRLRMVKILLYKALDGCEMRQALVYNRRISSITEEIEYLKYVIGAIQQKDKEVVVFT